MASNTIDEEKLKRLKGNFKDLKAAKKNVIRIFLASTFTDFKNEREFIMEKIYPPLRDKIKKTYKINLIIVDLRWGISNESSDKDSTDQVLKEIKNCQDDSIGPNFIALIGYRYGSYRAKLIIPKGEFEIIREEIIKNKGKERMAKKSNIKVIDFLDCCYSEDNNNSIYKLKDTDMVKEIIQKKDNSEKNKVDEMIKKIKKIIQDEAKVVLNVENISKNDFEKIREDIIKTKSNDFITNDSEITVEEFLDLCYKLDENDLENKSYKLGVTEHLIKKLKPNDEDKFGEMFSSLKNMIQNAAKKVLSPDVSSTYFTSVTGEEIHDGMLKLLDDKKDNFLENIEKVKNNCLIFLREITELKNLKDKENRISAISEILEKDNKIFAENQDQADRKMCIEKKVKDFIDSEEVNFGRITKFRTEVDKMKNDTNIQLANNIFTIEGSIKDTNFFEWKTNSVENEYYKAFGETFKHNVLRLVEKNFKAIESKIIKDEDNDEYHEVLNHAYFCQFVSNNYNKTNNNFIEDINQKLRGYIGVDKSTSKDENIKTDAPLFISGKSGSGKTTVIGHFIYNLPEDFLKNNLLITRFLGTTRKSSTIKKVYQSIIAQLKQHNQLAYNISTTDPTESEVKIQELKDNIINLIKEVLAKKEKNSVEKIILVFDAIDQLSSDDAENISSWIFSELPENVRVVYSVLSQSPFEEELKQQPEVKCYEIKSIEKKEANSIIESWLNNETPSRSLCSQKQSKALADVLERTETPNQDAMEIDQNNQNNILTEHTGIYPLHLKVLYNIVAKWPSSYIPDEEFINSNDPNQIKFKDCVNVKQTIHYLYKKLEILYGKELFSRCIFYITAFKNGITEPELIDILSIDNDVLSSVFEFDEPQIIRFPIALWRRLRYEINNFLTEKEADDETVTTWFHNAFVEASRKYYESFIDKEKRDELYTNIIDYYIGKYSKEPKTFTSHKKVVENRIKSGIKIDATRHTPRNTEPQEIKIKIKKDNSDEFEVRYNKRKLNELLGFILELSDDEKKVDALCEHIYFNYEFMHAKATLKEMDFVIDTHQEITALRDRIINNSDNAEAGQSNDP